MSFSFSGGTGDTHRRIQGRCHTLAFTWINTRHRPSALATPVAASRKRCQALRTATPAVPCTPSVTDQFRALKG